MGKNIDKILICIVFVIFISGCAGAKAYVIPLIADAKAKVKEQRNIYVALPTNHSLFESMRFSEARYTEPAVQVLLPVSGELDFAVDKRSFKIQGEKKKTFQIRSPNLPLARNLINHIKLKHKDLQVHYFYGAQLSVTEGELLTDGLPTDGLWLQVQYFSGEGLPSSNNYKPDVFSYYGFAFRSFAYLVDPISKRVLWKGACRKWFLNEDKYFHNKADFKIHESKFRNLNIQAFITSCTADLIRQWDERKVSGKSYALANCAKAGELGCPLGFKNKNINSKMQIKSPIDWPGYERMQFTEEEKKTLNAMVEEYYNKIH